MNDSDSDKTDVAQEYPSSELMAVLRSSWIGIGILGVLAHWPMGYVGAVALLAPWLVVLALLVLPGWSARTVDVWKQVLSTRLGQVGLSGLVLMVFTIVLLFTGDAALWFLIWLVALGTVVGMWRGPVVLRGQLIAWLLVVFTIAAICLFAEGVLRWTPLGRNLGSPRELQSWVNRYDRLWEQNVLGIRSPYETLAKPEGVVRIVTLGDSFTWGDKIADSSDTWPAQLEKELRRVSATPIEVINLGRNGFTTVNEAEMLRRLGWQFQPDLVVVQFYYNDVLPSGPNFSRKGAQWLIPPLRIITGRWRDSPAGRSAVLNLTETQLNRLWLGKRRGFEAWLRLYDEQSPHWRAMVEAIQEMGNSAKDRQVPAVFVMFPYFYPGVWENRPLPSQSIFEQVAAAAADAGFTVLDLTTLYTSTGQDLRRWWATPYDAHPGTAAAALAARVLADHIQHVVKWPALAGPGATAGILQQ